MKIKGNYYLGTLFVLFLCVAGTVMVARNFKYPLSVWKVSPIKEYVVQDLTGTLLGMKRLAADIAWVQLLQYYGSPEQPLNKEVEYSVSIAMTKYLFGIKPEADDECGEHGECAHNHYVPNFEGGEYRNLLKHCFRVTQLDPFFSYSYLYGAGSLAWNLKRPDEAIRLLQYGIDNMERYKADITKDAQQSFWRLNLYMAAIIYRNAGKYDQMVSLLEVAINQPECPTVMRTILASIYQQQGRNASALKLWLDIYESKDSSYRERAIEKIEELKLKLGFK